jgi:hypothetical protein
MRIAGAPGGVSVWAVGIESDRRETADGPHRGGDATRWHGPAHRAWASDRLLSAEPQLPGGPDAQELQARLPDPDSDAQCVVRASIDHGAGNGVGRRRDVVGNPEGPASQFRWKLYGLPGWTCFGDGSGFPGHGEGGDCSKGVAAVEWYHA